MGFIDDSASDFKDATALSCHFTTSKQILYLYY